jgi:hypothetical protein
MSRFAVDDKGLARLLEGRGKTRVVMEAVQNAWDEEGVTEVHVTLTDDPKRGRSRLVVEDDAPDGFADLTHAFTLFAQSKKVDDPQKRGRFNLGEKLLLSLCDSATVTSTTGCWEFTENDRIRRRTKLDRGSRIEAVIRFTDAERTQALQWLQMLIPPAAITTYVNGVPLGACAPVRSFAATLATEIADEEGVLRRTRRKTTVRLFTPAPGEQPFIFEMGIPVVEHDGAWHVDIAQKVPLNMDRDNVTPAYLREVRVAVLNEASDLITAEDARSTWVKEAASDDRVSQRAHQAVFRQRYGDKVVIADPSDPEANKEAVLRGYQVLHGGMQSKDEWRQTKRHGTALPAGQVTPSHSSIETSPDGTPPLAPADWTPGMHRVAGYARVIGRDLLGQDIHVSVYRVRNGAQAWYGPGALSFNLQYLGHTFFTEADQVRVDALLIHEFAHHRVKDHLSEAFHDECCRLGAVLRNSTTRLSGGIAGQDGDK